MKDTEKQSKLAKTEPPQRRKQADIACSSLVLVLSSHLFFIIWGLDLRNPHLNHQQASLATMDPSQRQRLKLDDLLRKKSEIFVF